MKYTAILSPRAHKYLVNYFKLSATIGVIGGLTTPFIIDRRRGQDMKPVEFAAVGLVAVSTYATFWPIILIYHIKN